MNTYEFNIMNTHVNKIIHEITPLSLRDCFYIVERHKTEFTYPIHTHKDFELNYVEKASGVKRIVGDNTQVIGDYDLVLITSSELEHVWEQSDCDSKQIREITIQFSPDLISEDMLNKNQFDSIASMLKRARHGLTFPMEAIMKVYNLINSLVMEKEGFYSFLKFLTILYELSQYEGKMLASSSFAKVQPSSDSRRILKIQTYLEMHYRETIREDEMAAMVNMAKVSFCRFFKQRTSTTMMDYLIKIRLGHAARLLVDTTNSITEVCFDCGFNNLSNFNRIFKKYKGVSPKDFRENYRKTKKLI
jgi:AraC-like DNA-binding protein